MHRSFVMSIDVNISIFFCKITGNQKLVGIFIIDGPGADPGFQIRRGALKKIAPSGGLCEKFWGISCEKSRFYA